MVSICYRSVIVMKNKKIYILFILFLVVGIYSGFIFVKSNNKLYCDSNFKLENGQCVNTLIVTPVVREVCPGGYHIESKECVLIEKISPTKKYYCSNTKMSSDDGTVLFSASTLSGTTCYYKQSHDPIRKPTCPAGLYLSTATSCRGSIELDAIYRSFNNSYYCPSDDYVLLGRKCILYLEKEPTIVTECLDGFKLKNNNCERTEYYDAKYTINCPGGYALENNICVREDRQNIKYEYICPDGYMYLNNVCQLKIYEEPYEK